MSSIRLLDCTLREAPLDKLMWGVSSIRKIIDGLQIAGVEIIEIGFLKNDKYVFGSTSFNKVEDIEPYLKEKVNNCIYVALVDYGRYDLNNLSDYNGKSIDAIRICFKHDDIDEVLIYAQKIRDKGYKVFIQHVDTMGYSDDEIIEFINNVNQFRPMVYSIVDTFGAMYSDELLHYVNIVAERLDSSIVIGLHAHNNLLLADSNAQIFIQRLKDDRNIIVDSSLYGCGRGAGNAHTELLAQYLNKKASKNYNVDEVLDLIDTVINAVREKTSWGYTIPYFISGMYNSHTYNVNHLLKRHNIKSRDLRAIIDKLDEKKKKEYDYQLLDSLYLTYFDRYVDDKEIVEQLCQSFRGKKVLLIGPGKTVVTQSDVIKSFINSNNPITIGVNNSIDGYKLDYIFCSSSIRYHDLKYQYESTNRVTRLIVTSNVIQDTGGNELLMNFSSLICNGWKNADSSFIMLLRLLLRCGVTRVYIAGIDGYKEFGNAFYKDELDTNLDEEVRIQSTRDNILMLQDIKNKNPYFEIVFLTESVYSEKLS